MIEIAKLLALVTILFSAYTLGKFVGSVEAVDQLQKFSCSDYQSICEAIGKEKIQAVNKKIYRICITADKESR